MNIKRQFILVCSLLISFAGRSSDLPDLIVLGEGETSTVGSISPVFHQYQFRADQLPSKKSWTVGSNAFPINLSGEAARARDFVARETTNVIELQQIKIEQFALPARYLKPEVDAPESTNQWLAAYTFSTTPQGKRQSIVSLLDGTYAQDNTEFTATRAVASIPMSIAPASGDSTSILTASNREVRYYPMERLTSSDIDLPKIQWDPMTQHFPLDINLEAVKAGIYLAKAKAIDIKSLSFAEVYISRFLPINTCRVKGLDIGQHLHHWVVAFVFCQKEGTNENGFEVYTMLDGTYLDIQTQGFCIRM